MAIFKRFSFSRSISRGASFVAAAASTILLSTACDLRPLIGEVNRSDLQFDALSPINESNKSSYTIRGSCTSGPVAISLNASVRFSIPCENGRFEKSLNLSSLPDGRLPLSGGVTSKKATAAATVLKDTTPPSISFAAGQAVWINQSTASLYTVEGDCSDEMQPVEVLVGSAVGRGTCASGAFSVVIDASTLADGPYTISAFHSDAAGNTDSETFNVQKDVVPPALITVTGLPSGQDPTTSPSGTVSGADVTQYSYLFGPSLTTTCLATWSYSASVPVATALTPDLSGIPNGFVRVCVRGADAAGNWIAASAASSTIWEKIAPNIAPAINTTGCATSASEDTAYSCAPVITDPDGPSLNVSFAGTHTCGAWLAVNASSGALSGSPTQSDVGTCTVSLTASDGSLSDTKLFSLTVNAVNDAPSLDLSGCAASLAQNSAYSCAPVTTDPDNSTFTYAFSGAHTCGAWLTVNASTGALSGTPGDNDVGSCTVSVSVNDGAASHTPSFSLAVTNLAPTLTIANASALLRNAPATEIRNDAAIQASEEGYGIYSFDHAGTTGTKCSDNALSLAIDANSGAISYRPATNYVGTCNIRVVFDDQNGVATSSVATEFSVTVNDLLLSIVDLTVAENVAGGTATLTVSIPANAYQDVTFDFATADGTAVASGTYKDYDATTSTGVTIPAGSSSVQIQVPLTDDPRDEADQSFTIALSNASGATISDGSATVTITDDDAEPSITLGTTQTVSESVGSVSLVATLSVISEKTVSATFSTADGSAVSSGSFKDFDGVSTPFSIAPGALTHTASVAITDDPRDEDDQSFTTSITAAANATLGTASASITLQDNDAPPTIELSNLDSATLAEGVTGAYSLTLSQISEKSVSLTLSTSDGTALSSSDYTAINNSLIVIAPGGSSTQGSVSTTDDALSCESGETFDLTLGGYTNVNAGTTTTVTYTITENDYPSVAITAAPIIEGQSAMVTATLSAVCPNYDIPLNWRTLSGTANVGQDFPNQSGTVTIQKNMLANTFSVSTTDDTAPEPAETFAVATSWGTSSAGGGNIQLIDNDLSQTVAGIGVAKVSTVGDATCAIITDGSVKCWGSRRYNTFVGDNPAQFGAKASEVLSLAPKVKFAAGLQPVEIGLGAGFGCARMSDGTVRCYGNFGSGARLTGDTNYGGTGHSLGGREYEGLIAGSMAALPAINLGTGRTATRISVGAYHTCAILDNGKLRCWGYGPAIGVGSTSNYGTSSDHLGDNLPYVDVGSGLTVTQVGAGYQFTCALLSDQTVKCWGEGGYGKLGNGGTATIGDAAGEMSAIAALPLGQPVLELGVGSEFACARLQDKSVKCWGQNDYGQLGQGNTNSIGDAPGEVAALSPVSLGAGVLAEKIAVGVKHVCVLTDAAEIKCWGLNDYGQLGVGSTAHKGDGAGEMGSFLASVPLPSAAIDVWSSYRNSCAKLSDNSVKCWGNNGGGDLAIGSTNHIGDAAGEVAATPAIDPGVNYEIVGLSSSASVGFGGMGLCYILRNTIASTKEARCFGDNRNGKLGLENMFVGDAPGEMGVALPALNLGTGLRATDIHVMVGGACALFDNQKVKCWGRHETTGSGATANLGIDTTVGDGLPYVNLGTGAKVQKLQANRDHACALLTDGRLKCWGYNSGWQMGYHTYGSIVGDSMAEVGDNMPTLNFGTGRKVVDFSTGLYHTCAILDNGKTKCVGNSYYGALGNGNNFTIGDNIAEVGDAIPYLDLGTVRSASALALGLEASCALRDNGSAVCWGSNEYNQLGTRTAHIGDGASEMGNLLPPIDWGTGRSARQIIRGLDRGFCAILDNQNMKCWGINGYNGITWGRLGLGNNTSYYGGSWTALNDSYPAINIGTGLKVKDATTSSITCAVTTDERLKCWGYNYDGRLGLEDLSTRGDQAAEMGDALPFVDLGLTAGSGPASFTITGVSGGTDSTADSLLGHTEPTLQWSASTGAVDYLVAVLGSDQSTVVCPEQTTSSTSFSFVGCTLSSGMTYYARVVARDGSANTKAAANSLFPFSVDTALPGTFLISGVSGDLDSTADAVLTDGLIPTITWTSPEGGAGRFDVTVFENDGTTVRCSTVAKASGSTSHRFSSCTLTQGGSYLARVIAYNVNATQSREAANSLFAFAVGDTSGPSAFAIDGVAESASDLEPGNLLEYGSIPTIAWKDTVGEDSYDVTIYESDGVTVKCATANVADDQTNHTFDGCHLTAGGSYLAVVTAKDAFASANATNSPYAFTVANTAGSFQILGVQGGAFDTTTDAHLTDSNTPTIHWTASNGATSYSISILTLDGAAVCTGTSGAATSKVMSGCYLSANTSYHIQMSSSNGSGGPVPVTFASNDRYLFTVADYPILSIDQPTVTEGTAATFNITASKVWSQDLTVKYRTASLRADAYLDFTPTTGTVTIPAGLTTASFTVATRDDSTLEVDEVFTASLYDPSNSGLSRNSISLATIQDNEAPNASAPVAVKVGGNNFSCALFQDGRIKCWGDASYGQLGYPAHFRGDEAAEAGNGAPVVDLGVGFSVAETVGGSANNNTYTCARSTSGVVKCWGDGSYYGILGAGSGAIAGLDAGTMGAATPTINLNDTATSIHGGSAFACALLTGGGIKCWGRNEYGQLGLGDVNHRGDNANEMGANLPYVNLGVGALVTQLETGPSHSCALLDTGDVKCWGRNHYGQLGRGNTLTIGDGANEMGSFLPRVDLGTGRTAKAISVGYEFNCAILDNDLVKCWGRNDFWQLGLGHGNATGDGANEMGDFLGTVSGLGTVKKVAASVHFACAIKTDDSVYCWGDNTYGKLGRGGGYQSSVNLGTGVYATELTAAGSDMCAILNTGAVKCWGYNRDGRLGLGVAGDIGDNVTEVGDNLQALDFGGGLSVIGITHGPDVSNICHVSSANTVKCFGNGRYGGVGLSIHYIGDEASEMGSALRAIDFGTSEKVVDFTLGNRTGCAIFESGRVKCWGDGSSYNQGPVGVIGDDVANEVATSPFHAFGGNMKAISIAAGDNHTCILTDDFETLCTGYGVDGRIVTGMNLNVSPNDLILPANFGSGRRAIQLSANTVQTCAVLDNFDLKCFGSNDSGRLGQGNATPLGNSSWKIGDYVSPIDLGTGRKALATASAGAASCAITDNDALKCWGSDTYGTLGSNRGTSIGDAAGEMGDALVPTPVGTSVASVSGQFSNFCTLTWTGTASLAKCWGLNDVGQLGLGHAGTIGDSAGEVAALTGISLGTGQSPVSVMSNNSVGCSLLDDNTIKCWGEGRMLGTGTTFHRGDGAGEMGDSLPTLELGP